MTIMGLPTGSMQAAHFLPGTVRIGGAPLWEFTSDPKCKGHIEALFADVEHLPTVYNQADTAAEAKGTGVGLCGALAAACQSLLIGAGGTGGMQAAHKIWCDNALIGIRNAVSGKRGLGVLPDLVKDADGNIDLSAREAASASTHNRDDTVRILTYYLEDQAARNWDWVQTGCRSAIADARMNFRP